MRIYKQPMIFVLGMVLAFLLPHVGAAQIHAGRAAKGTSGVHRSHAPKTSFKHGGRGYGGHSFMPRYDGKSFERGDYHNYGKSRYRSYEPRRSYQVPYDYGKRFANPRGSYGEHRGDFDRHGYGQPIRQPFNDRFGENFYGFEPKNRVDRSYTYYSEFPLRRPPKTYGPESEFPLRRSHPFHKNRFYDERFEHFHGHYPHFQQNRFDRDYGYHRYDRGYPKHRYDYPHRYYQPRDFFSVPFKPGERYIN